MSFEDFDQQINDAAEKHHPAYREEAWSRMEALLDKHLPRDDRKKRRVLFVLPLLLLLCAGGIFIMKNNQKKNDHVFSERTGNGEQGTGIGERGTGNGERGLGIREAQPITGNQQPVTSNLQPETGNQNTLNPESPNPPIRNSKISNQQPEAGNQNTLNPESANPPIRNSKSANPIIRNSQIRNSQIRKSSNFQISSVKENENNIIVNENNNSTSPIPLPYEETLNNEPAEHATMDQTAATTSLQELLNDQPEQNTNGTTTAKKETVKIKTNPGRFRNNFAVTLNAGSGFSSIHFSDPRQKRLITGIGLQYQLLKNISVSTGFFQTNMVYAAKPSDYKGYLYTPSGYWLSSITGDCKAYEIPVSIAYTIRPAKKLSFFASAGATSIIMKREDYVYIYKSWAAGAYAYKHGVKNKSGHFFASFDLSLGVQQNIGHRYFLRAAPYISLPMHGVGIGNIKLKSAGIMFSAGIKPFVRK